MDARVVLGEDGGRAGQDGKRRERLAGADQQHACRLVFGGLALHRGRYPRVGAGEDRHATPTAGGGYSNADFDSPPRSDPVNGPVLVSADGRVITAIGPVACGHAPRLAARSYPHKVTLTFVNPDTNCDAEMTGTTAASTRLARPPGARSRATVSRYRASARPTSRR